MVHLFLAFNSFLGLLNKNKRLLSILFFALFVFSAIRYDYGNDYASYLRWFNYIKSTGSNPFGEQILYTFLNKISPSFNFLLTIVSGFYLYTVYRLIKNNVSDNYIGVSFLIFLINPYLFLMNLSAIRQSIAIALFIIAVYFSKKRKIIPYIVLILLATLFHKSAIILLPFYFWANGKKVKKWHIIAILAVIVFLFFTPDKFNDLITYFLEFFDDKTYNHYFSEGTGNSIRSTVLTAVYLIYLLLNIFKLDGKALVYTKLYVIALIFAVLAYKLSMLTRLQMYFDIFSVVSLPGIIEWNIKNNQKQISVLFNVYIFPLLILLIYILRYYSFFTNELWQSFATYQTILGAHL